jgi:hypothetical protein
VVGVPKPSKIAVEYVDGNRLPLWVVAHHRLTRLGHADAVLPPTFAGGHYLVRFVLENRPARFGELAHAERAWLLYRS